MALRSLATRVRIPAAASALGRRPIPATPAAARSRFLGTVPHSPSGNGRLNNATRPLESMDDEPLDEQLFKIGDAIRERREELRKAYGEIRRIAKWYACTIIGVPLFLCVAPIPDIWSSNSDFEED